MAVGTSWGRWGGATLESRTAATLVPVATGPRRGPRARYEGGVTPTLRAFTDDPTLVFGAECVLPAAPLQLRPVDADTIMLIRDGAVWLVSSPRVAAGVVVRDDGNEVTTRVAVDREGAARLSRLRE